MKNKEIVYWNNDSKILDYKLFYLYKRYIIHNIERYKNVITHSALDEKNGQDINKFIKKEDGIYLTESIRSIIVNLKNMLRGDAYFKKVDLLLLNIESLVGRRVRLQAILKYFRLFEKVIISNRKNRFKLFFSFNYSDLIFIKVARKYKAKFFRFLPLLIFYEYFVYWLTLISNFTTFPNKKLVANYQFGKNQPQREVGFIATMETHFKSLIPLIKRLREKNKRMVLILPYSSKKWKNLNSIPEDILRIYIRDFITDTDIRKYKIDQIRYLKIYKDNKADIKKIFKYKEISYWLLVRLGIKDYFKNVLPTNILYIKVAERILDLFKIKYLIGSRIRKDSDIAFFAVAKCKDNIKTTTILHGLISDDYDAYYSDGRYDFQGNVCVWNKDQIRIIRQKQFNKDNNLIITGNPQWDFIEESYFDKAAFFSKINMEERYNKIITFCAQPSNKIEIWRDMVKAVKDANDTLLIIKSHPVIKKEFIRKKINDIVNENTIIVDDNDVNLYNLLKLSDLMITIFSTTLFEGLIIGTPIALYKKDKIKMIEACEKFDVPVINNFQELKRVMEEDKSKNDYVNDCEKFKKEYLNWHNDMRGNIINHILNIAYYQYEKEL